MLWFIVIILIFILIAVLGGGAFLSFLFGLLGLGFVWMITALLSQSATIANWSTFAAFVMAIVVGVVTHEPAPDEDDEKGEAAEIKLCPFCAEEIKAAAIVCKHCGSQLSIDGNVAPE